MPNHQGCKLPYICSTDWKRCYRLLILGSIARRFLPCIARSSNKRETGGSDSPGLEEIGHAPNIHELNRAKTMIVSCLEEPTEQMKTGMKVDSL